MKKTLTTLLLTLGLLAPVYAQTNLSQGGTGWNTSTVGDLLVGTSSTLRYTRLPVGSTGNILWVTGGKPAWTSTSSLGFLPFASSTLYVPYVGATADVNIGAFSFLGHAFRGDASDGALIEANNGTDVAIFGAANTSNTTFFGNVSFNANNILGITKATITNASTTNQSLSGSFYDSISSAGTSGNILSSTGTSTLWVSTSSLGISTPPGGSNTQIQFNDGGFFGGDADLTYNKTSNTLLGSMFRGSTFDLYNSINLYSDNTFGSFLIGLSSPGVNKISYDGSSNSAILDFNNISGSDKTFTFPNLSGTLCLTSVCTSTTTPSVGSFGYVQFASSTAGYFDSKSSFIFSTTSDRLTFNNGSSTVFTAGSLFVTGQSTLATASATALSVSGQTVLANASSSAGITASTFYGALLGTTGNFSSTLNVTGKTTLGNASTSALTVSGFTILGNASSTALTVTGQTMLGNASSTALTGDTLYSTFLRTTNASTTNFKLAGLLYDSVNATGTNGMVLQSTGAATTWVSTSSLNISASLSGGTVGKVARWLTANTLSTGLFLDNGTVAGVNATSTGITFNVQGTSGVNVPFNVATSSNSLSLFRVLVDGSIAIASTTSTFFSGNPSALFIDTTGKTSQQGMTVLSNVNNFFENNIINQSAGANAQACSTATNNIGTLTTGFISICANSSAFNNPQAYNTGGAGDTSIMGYSSGDFILANATATRKMLFVTGGSATTTNTRMWINGGGQIVIATTTAPTYGFTVSTTTQFTSAVITKVVGYASAASTTIDLNYTDIATTTVNRATTFVNPVGTLYDGANFQIKVLATTTQTLYWQSMFSSSTNPGILPATAASGTTMFIFQYDKYLNKLQLTGIAGPYN